MINEVGRVEGVTYIVDPADPRVDDYRELNSIAVRAEMEGDEFFMGEGYVPIDRMLDSGHQMRSVLLHPKRLRRFVATMSRPEMAGVPVYVAEQDVIAALAIDSVITTFAVNFICRTLIGCSRCCVHINTALGIIEQFDTTWDDFDITIRVIGKGQITVDCRVIEANQAIDIGVVASNRIVVACVDICSIIAQLIAAHICTCATEQQVSAVKAHLARG